MKGNMVEIIDRSDFAWNSGIPTWNCWKCGVGVTDWNKPDRCPNCKNPDLKENDVEDRKAR